MGCKGVMTFPDIEDVSSDMKRKEIKCKSRPAEGCSVHSPGEILLLSASYPQCPWRLSVPWCGLMKAVSPTNGVPLAPC